jgi:hypothetical protein
MNMKERIELMARRTWDVIGSDMLTALEEAGETPIMDKETVIELVCDASYMMIHGGDKEAYTFWTNLPTYDAKQEAVRTAFPHQRYGW